MNESERRDTICVDCEQPGHACRCDRRMTASEVLSLRTPTKALDTQVAGNHYKDMKIQPVEYIHANGIPFCEGSVIKYVSRWRAKGGVDDLRKARHFLDLLIELESAK